MWYSVKSSSEEWPQSWQISVCVPTVLHPFDCAAFLGKQLFCINIEAKTILLENK